MKKAIFTFLTLALILTAGSKLSAQNLGQYCGSPSNCQVLGGPPSGGFDPADSTPCVVQGVAYNHAIQFTMYSVFNYIGSHNVDSIRFERITNLPCGLCWSVDRADRTYRPNQDGCLNISGTTNDAAGQYKFNITLTAWIDHLSAAAIPPGTVDAAGIKIFIRVQSPGGQCNSVDTSSSYQGNLVASANCPTSVEELSGLISALTVSPNPAASGAVLNFMAEKTATYTIRMSNITGAVVNAKTIEVKQGNNSIPIERNNLPAGVYFISLSDGQSAITTRLNIAD